jgi:hypothetical protein
MENRDNIVRKLAALRSTFEHENTSENEALAARDLYTKLMDKYRLTETDLDLKDSGIKVGKFSDDNTEVNDLAPMCWLIKPIAMVSETRGVCLNKTTGLFFGTMADVQHADFLWSTCETALKSAWGAYKVSPNYRKYIDRGNKPAAIEEAFITGWLQRQTAKLLEMVPEKPEPSRNALIVLKNELITTAMGEAGKTEQSKAVAIHGTTAIHYEGGLEADKVRLRKEAEESRKLTDGRG